MYYTGGVFQQTFTYYDMLIYMLWSEKAFIQTYDCMGVRTDEISTETIIFDRGVREYVRVNDYDLWPGFCVTEHDYN